jgi:hypothetical protein
MKKRISFLLALALLLTSCGGGSGAAATATAATMHLRRTEGTVSVADGEGKSVKPTKDLGLFSGYGVDTQAESYAWIDLDEVKLTKLDQNSEVEIQKEDKRLTIEVKSGSLFFNVTEPLAEDESLEIRCSTMVVGIRGTCGWVTDKTAALLEGVVTVTAGEQEVTISAGEMAVMTAEGALEVKPLSADSIPDFVREEQEEDSALVEEEVKADSDSGIDVLASVDPLYRRDMYTYSRMLHYNADGVLTNETEYFPDEQGRIGREVSHASNPNTGMEVTLETIYIYNDEGTLQTRESDNGVIYTVTENTADHRKMVRGDADMVYIEYYDEQGRRIRSESFLNGELSSNGTFNNTYDAEGRLIRTDMYEADGASKGYALYEYD